MTTPSVSVGPSRGGRRAERRRVQRQKQRRIAILAGGGAVLLLVVATVFVVTRGGDKAATSGAPERTQKTLLLEVQSGADVVSAALLAHDSAKGGADGAAVLLPPTVIVSVPGGGSTTLRSSLVAGRAQQAREAVADLLGVTVDAGWVLDTTTLAALVDRVGGVQVDVDVDVVNGSTVVVGKGSQRLPGASAVTVATYLAPGEQEQARLARLQGVLDALITALPDEKALTGLLGSLGGASNASLPLPQLASFLHGLAQDSKAQRLQYDSLPVVPIDPGNGTTSSRIDAAPLASLVGRLLAPSVPASRQATGNRVYVLNGVGTPGLGSAVRAKLLPAGLIFVGSRNAPSFGRPKTVVLVREATPELQALGSRVARALGVPEDSVQTSDELGSLADVIVVVGQDFKP